MKWFGIFLGVACAALWLQAAYIYGKASALEPEPCVIPASAHADQGYIS